MNKLIVPALLVSLVTCSTILFAATESSINTANIPFDGRDWIAGHHDANEYQTTTEYVPQGQTVDNWTELVTVSEFFGIQDKTTAEQMMSDMLQIAQENCSGVKKNLVQSLTDGVIFEWETTGCKVEIPGANAPEFDISRIVFTKDRVFMMQYASKTRPTAEKREQWIKILASSVFSGTDEFTKFQKEIAK
jgi:hypothetical protein